MIDWIEDAQKFTGRLMGVRKNNRLKLIELL